MMSKVSGLARASADRSHAAGEREERPAARAGGAKIQRTFGNRIAGLLAELTQPEALGGAAAQEAARRGLSGPGQALPHLTAIQRSFGRHDVRGVAAHADAAARSAAEVLGAEAFASGEHVAFAAAPDLRTAAHEAAHVVQQRAGIELPGGLDRPGDRFERHAEAVAEQVVAGRSAEPLLDAIAGPGAAAAGPAVQRRLVVTAKDVKGTRSASELRKLGGKQDVLAQLIDVLEAYESTNDPEQELVAVLRVRELVDRWRHTTPRPKSTREWQRCELLWQLEAEAQRECMQIRWQMQYVKDDRPFAHLDAHAPNYAFTIAKDLKEGTTGSPMLNAGPESLKVVQDNDLSAAEVAAIRVFSLSDYRYINPAVANDMAWMRTNYPGASDAELAQRMQEGSVHAVMMLEGLAKLPPWRGTAYRGERMTPKMFFERYAERSTVKLESFASMATDRAIAEEFSGGNSKTPADATVSLVVTLDVTYARDIGKLSTMRRENEVLLLPGAEFAIEQTKRLRNGDPGHDRAPAATAWYEIRLRQIR